MVKGKKGDLSRGIRFQSGPSGVFSQETRPSAFQDRLFSEVWNNCHGFATQIETPGPD
jgi:hypothetical protein